MTNYSKRASESTVEDFILIAKSIPGVNFTPRDEVMLRGILTAEKITDGGIEVVFTDRTVVVASREINARYSRRKRHG